MSRVRFAVAAAVLAAFGLLAGGQAASASEGSVPVEVTMYATAKDGMVAKLNDVFGIGGKGSGIDFNDTTTAGPLSRVFAWTPEFLAGGSTDVPVERLNEWVTTISIDDKVVGFATIWINDATVEPELATFTRGVALGTALLTVPADATLVRDDLGGAWFTLTGTDLTPLDSGTSGVDAVTPLASYQKVLAGERPADLTPADPNQGLVFGGITLAAVVVLVVVTLVLLSRRRAASVRRADAAAQVEPAPASPADVPTPPDAPREPATEPAQVTPAKAAPAAAKKSPAKPATAKPATVKPATVKPATAKPATVKPATAKPATAPAGKTSPVAATKKPATAAKPAAAVKKPAARKPPAAQGDSTPEPPSA